jgi:hypothetical protein
VFWKRKTNQTPLGVPLGDLALMLSTGTIKTSFEGNALLAKHDHYASKVEVVPAAPGATKDEPIKAVVQVTTELPAPIQKMMKGCEIETTAAFNSMAGLGELTFDKSRVYVGSRLTIFERDSSHSLAVSS